MSDFETIYRKNGEAFIWSVLENWERANKVRYDATISLESRWDRFIEATNDNLSSKSAALLAAA